LDATWTPHTVSCPAFRRWRAPPKLASSPRGMRRRSSRHHCAACARFQASTATDPRCCMDASAARGGDNEGGGHAGRGKTGKGEQVIPNQAVSEERHSGQCLLAPPPSTTTASASASAVTPSALCVAAGYPYARGRRGGGGGCDDRVRAGISWEVDDEGYDETRMTRKRFRLI
jgi:hypothetical protein